jgi:hypothetical protein
MIGKRAPIDKTIADYERFLVKCENSNLTWPAEKCRTVLDALEFYEIHKPKTQEQP